MQYQAFYRQGPNQVLINQGDDLKSLALLAEHFHINNNTDRTWIFDTKRERYAKLIELDAQGRIKSEQECVWTKPGNPGAAEQPICFEAVSFNSRTGQYLRTQHNYLAQALKRLQGNSRHSNRHIIDYTPRSYPNGLPMPPRELRPFGRDQ